jgi:hypothetical protein
MTTGLPRPNTGRSVAAIAGTIVLIALGFAAIFVVAFVDLVLVFSRSDSPGDIDGAFAIAFYLLVGAAVAWLIASIVSIVFLVRRRTAWWVALLGVIAPILAGVGGFIAVTAVVK